MASKCSATEPMIPLEVDRQYRPFIHKMLVTCSLVLLLALSGPLQKSWAQTSQSNQNSPDDLKDLSLEQLGNVQVTTTSKEPEDVWKTPAAIYVITQEDIRRSGATSIPEILRLAPGVEVARIDSDHWAVGIRGFGGEFSKSLLVLIDGRSVYSPLFAGSTGRCRTRCLRISSASK